MAIKEDGQLPIFFFSKGFYAFGVRMRREISGPVDVVMENSCAVGGSD
jgi:hypothetical protein